ncbi:hypothetical protein JCM10908_001807 [Rhodotorula pacifica]|uniref:THO complex subunit THO1/HPR1 n=1 Tax=Rhodotorula pacifica TaxID=1495444 RepID=UPI00316EB094
MATAMSYSDFRQLASDSLAALASSLLSRRRQADTSSSDEEIKSLALATLTDIRATRITAGEREQEAPEEGESRWQVEAKQAALVRSLEIVVEQAAEDDKQHPGHLADMLDVVLAAAEDGYIDETVPLTMLAGLLELRPVSECESILGYIESRISRLTLGMEYQRGRGPILLRLLNDLLRRLPRSQSHSVILSGRILMLLSWVYPLNEKSGVNLRGNFNIGKGFNFTLPEKEKSGQEEEEGKGEGGKEDEPPKMEVEEGEEAEEETAKDEGAQAEPAAFYKTFWSLQQYFINPPSLFQPSAASTSSAMAPFPSLRDGVRSTLLAFNTATKKAKDLAGSAKEVGKLARAGVDDDDEMEGSASEQALEEYFFPKFLTSPDLLELELADPNFRRQILVQILILFQYLLGFSPTERSRTEKLPVTNMSAFPGYVLPAEVETWLRELRSRTLDELDAMEGGRKFRKAVQLVLQRDQNWIDWKLRSCASFLLPSINAAEQSEKARNKLRATMRKPKRYPYRMGNANLSRTWEKNLTSLDDFEPDVADDELRFILREYRLEKNRIKQQEAQFARAAPGSSQRYEIEQALEQRRTRLQALHWRAIRSASTQHLRFFSQIGAGDLEKLEQLIEDERRKREDEAEAAELARSNGQGQEKAGMEGEGEGGYDSDTSVLRMTKGETPEVEEEKEAKDNDAKEGLEEKKAPAGGGDESGTPPPPDKPSSAAAVTEIEAGAGDVDAVEDEPGTPPPPPKPTAAITSPGTPKRPREEEAEDVAMQEGEGSKRLKVA